MVRTIRIEEINVSHSMMFNAVHKLLWIHFYGSGTSDSIKGTHAYGSVIGMDFIFSPRIEGKDHIWTPLTDDKSYFFSELDPSINFTIIVALEKGNSLYSLYSRCFSLLLFSHLGNLLNG